MSEHPHKRIFLFIIPNRHTLYLLFKRSLKELFKELFSKKKFPTNGPILTSCNILLGYELI